ncbi:helix-turn-helix domain-containing protein [Micromonospora zamorensis]|uniref:Transcriptional regulator n=3 Tax=Micromonospora TaxID=1873 RepID=A0A3N9WUJ1_9ACTN|nr:MULTISPECIES: transcriptional regulator [Micromonospora]RQW99266.1 transcriptional regulator [Micromonospora inaquosa]RQX04484.1 transcriptional regulator [Micromonospora arida]WSK48398.1 helix-turn-helix domain-containing protein [Micromonospora zamorensis]
MARQVPGKPRRLGAAGGITPGQVAEARKDLGRHLAAWRGVAGMTQVELAKLICYSRSQIGNVEIGRESTTRRFWQGADAAVGADGALLAAFDQVDALVRDFHAQEVQARERQRRHHAAPPAVPTAEAECPGECGCTPMVVGRWTGREVRALREALRMNVRAFAEHLGVTTATVSRWEHRRAPAPPRVAAQSALDQALTLVDTDSKARFRLLLTSADDTTPRAHGGRATKGRSTVTPIHQADRTRPAS